MRSNGRLVDFEIRFSCLNENVIASAGGGSASDIGSFDQFQDFARAWIGFLREGSPTLSAGEFGRRLAAEFPLGGLVESLQVAFGAAHARGKGLRVKIRAERDLVSIPWELLWVERSRPEYLLEGHLILCPGSRVVRAGVSEVSPPPLSELRVLLIQANPSTKDFPTLTWLEAEHETLKARLAGHPKVSLTPLFDAVPPVVERRIRELRPHVVHFSGHCHCRSSGSRLVLQGTEGEAFLSAEGFAKLLRETGVELAILNACDSAGRPSGVAEELHAAGIPSVIGLQGSVLDAGAPRLIRHFYEAVLDGATIEDALAEVRQAQGPGSNLCYQPIHYSNSLPAPLLPPHEDVSSGAEAGMIGRVKQLEEIVSKIRNGAGLVTIAGAGGIGKSTLARVAASVLGRSFSDGVHPIPCDAVTDSSDLYLAVASTVKCGSHNGGDARERVREHFQGARALLILDGFEQAVSAGHADLVDDLREVTGCPCLVTSRTILGLAGEVAIDLEPLALPSESGANAEAVELFLKLSGLKEPLSEHDRDRVHEICGLLEGMPLAIQLAAKRHHVLGLDVLVDLLRQSRLETLGGESSPLSAAIDRSLSLVSKADRHLLWQITVFVGPFDWEDLRAVAGVEAYGLIDQLTQISNYGLIIVERSAGSRRYRVLDTVREYMGRLVQDETLALQRRQARERHCAHFAAKSQGLAEKARKGKWEEYASEVLASLGNFRAAVAYAAQAGKFEELATLTDSLSRLFSEAGLLQDFWNIVEVGMPALEATQNKPAVARLLGLMGAAAARTGDDGACTRYWLRRAELSEELGDFRAAADCFSDIAIQMQQYGDRDGMEAMLLRAEGILDDHPDLELSATVMVTRARDAANEGDYDRARELAEQIEGLIEKADNQDALLFVHLNLGRVWRACGGSMTAGRKLRHTLERGLFAERLNLTAMVLLEFGGLFESMSGLLESAYLSLRSAELILKQVGSRHAAAARRRREAFLAAHPEAARFEIEWRPTPWRAMVDEVARRARDVFGSEPA